MTMSTKYMLRGTTIDIIQYNEDQAVDKLPPAVYSVHNAPFRGYYLSCVSDTFELPPKLFGNIEQRIEKCLRAFSERHGSTGVLLTGHKGTGKTLLMSALANEAMKRFDIPTIMVREAHHGEGFESFMRLIGPCVVLFDEFGKHYDKSEEQARLLSYFDGIDKTKRLNVVTENQQYDLNAFLLDRPGRALYHFKYRKLDEESVRGFCEASDLPADRLDELISIYHRTSTFTFDMLQNIVAETKRTGESIKSALKDMNIDLWVDPEYMRLIAINDKRHPSRIPSFVRGYEPIKGDDIFAIPDEDNSFIEIRWNTIVAQDDDDDEPDYAPEPRAISKVPDSTMEKYSHCQVEFEELKFRDKKKLIFETIAYQFVFEPNAAPPIPRYYRHAF